MKNDHIQMGKPLNLWRANEARTITFCVTEDCNLACKYCYIVGKNGKNKMEFPVAQKAIDYILSSRDIFNEPAVIWEFIGGEPFLEIDLIDKICDYIKIKTYILNHPWFENYRFCFSTNGLLYHTNPVQDYIRKNHKKLSIGISVDGNKMKHDLQRVYSNGQGSYDDVIKNIELWQRQFPGYNTKATFSHDDLPYLKDSIISLWNIGLKDVAANVVFEDVWHEGDDALFETQLKELADYIIEHGLWKDHNVRFFQESLGLPLNEEELRRNHCGAGLMLAIDYKGDFFPCIRFVDYSLSNQKGYCIGNIDEGINSDLLRPFLALNIPSQSSGECVNCEVAKGCAWCQGFNYDSSKSGSIYQRATFNCLMHKANCRANDYFWDRLDEKLKSGLSVRKRRQEMKEGKHKKYLYFLLQDKSLPFCNYDVPEHYSSKMSSKTIQEGLKYCEEQHLTPVFIGTEEPEESYVKPDHLEFIKSFEQTPFQDDDIIVFDRMPPSVATYCGGRKKNCILHIDKKNVIHLTSYVKDLSACFYRINLVIRDLAQWNSDVIQMYEKQLNGLIDFVSESYAANDPLEINVITDILEIKEMCNCDAGEHSFTLAPNGQLYICPAFYYNNPKDYIGTLETGIDIPGAKLLSIESAPICQACDSFHCKRCKYLNKKLTTQINIPSETQCFISHMERNASARLQKTVSKYSAFINYFDETECMDPLKKIKRM